MAMNMFAACFALALSPTLQSTTSPKLSVPSVVAAADDRSLAGSETKALMPLFVASTVPIAFGSFAPAVQLVGELSNTQALLLQCGTYLIAATAVLSVRLWREGHLRVSRSNWRAGIELGLWIFVAATLQSFGLQRTTAPRAGFLVRLSTVIVPVVEAFARRRVSLLLVSAVTLSVAGVGLMVLSPGAPGVRMATWQGDALVALSALFYSGHILRLGRLAPENNPLALATAKSVTQFACTLIVLGGLLSFSSPLSLTSLVPNAMFAKAVLFTGTFTCAFPMWAQGFAQQTVRPTHASLIYATAPVWNALIAAAVLGQTMAPRALAGACLLMIGMGLSLVGAVSEGQPARMHGHHEHAR